ncbi:MAG: DUF4276 family protein [Schwartzia sp.]|nr:DUF4276 family protein [Schwartzia sp. (in: firmicutes)]
MLKLLLQGEGPTDCGTVNYQTGTIEEGPVQIFIRKILGETDVTMNLFPRSEMELSSPKHRRIRLQPHNRNLKGHGIRAYLLSIEAMRQKCDGGMLYVDADKESGVDARKESACQKRYDEIKTDILRGFQAKELRGVAAIPMKMIESWMIGDEKALPKAFGGIRQSKHKKDNQKGAVESCPAKPELDWGDKANPSSNYPKNRLSRILSAYNREACREVFCEIAKNADITTLRKTCPISFDDFHNQLIALRKEI